MHYQQVSITRTIFFPQRKLRQDDCSSHKYYQLQSKNQEIMNHKKQSWKRLQQVI